MHSLTFKTKLALVSAIFFWASAFPGIRAGLEGYSPGSLALLRFIIAALCMVFLVIRLPKNRPPIPLGDKFRIMLAGAFGIGVYHIALNTGELTVPSGIASFIISQSPVFAVVFALIFLKEQFTAKAFLGLAISIVGVGLITLSQMTSFEFRLGILYVAIAAMTGSIFSILQKPLLRKYNATEITAYAIWGAVISLLIYLPTLSNEIHTASKSATLATIYLGIFPAAIAYIAWSYTLQAMSVARASAFLYFMPVIATLLGWLWLNEVPNVISFAGGLIALVGVWLINHAHRPMIKK